MAIHIHPLGPSAVPLETAQLNAGVSHLNLAAQFQALFDELNKQHSGNAPSESLSGLAAAGAASADARSAATAAAKSASSVAATAAASDTTAAGPATAATSDPNASLSAEQVFGANPWLTNPTGVGPTGMTFGYNPLYFATANTAAEVAQMLGGTVVQENEFTKDTPGNPFSQQQPNEMVELPDGAMINPGIIASLYTHGYPQNQVEQAISSEVASAEALVTSIET